MSKRSDQNQKNKSQAESLKGIIFYFMITSLILQIDKLSPQSEMIAVSTFLIINLDWLTK